MWGNVRAGTNMAGKLNAPPSASEQELPAAKAGRRYVEQWCRLMLVEAAKDIGAI